MKCSHRYIWFVPAVASCVLLLMLVGCSRGSDEAEAGRERVSVVATVGMIADLGQRIAGEHAEVEALMRPGIDPHLYAPTRDDLAKLLAAELVLYNGLKLEGRMSEALRNAATAERKVVPVSEVIDPALLLRLDEAETLKDGSEKLYDPHVWMDPSAWAAVVPVICDALIAVDPDHAQTYERNAAALEEEMLELHAYAQRTLDTVPEAQRVLVTAHDAFGYFGRQYGFEVLGIQGISTQSEAGVRDIERLVDVLAERKVPAVFVESTVSERNINALIAGAKARGHDVRIGGELFSDAMGPAGTPEGTYAGMLRHNIDTITEALGGTTGTREGSR